jgi:hypothetical protein
MCAESRCTLFLIAVIPLHGLFKQEASVLHNARQQRRHWYIDPNAQYLIFTMPSGAIPAVPASIAAVTIAAASARAGRAGEGGRRLNVC